jgi:FkbH-like protein
MLSELDYFQLIAEAKRPPLGSGARQVRLALLADCSTQHFLPLLKALFRRVGIEVELFEGGFDAIDLEVRNPQSPLYLFAPDFVAVINSIQSLRDRLYRTRDREGFVEEVRAQTIEIWNCVQQHSNAVIVQSNFVAPIERVFGNYDLQIPTSIQSVAHRLNNCLVEDIRNARNVILNDVNALASWIGRQTWFDERFWSIAKSFCGLSCLPFVARNIVDIVAASKGRAMKCLVLDLDNTVWGGVVGDDGPFGIRIAAHGDGEPFYRFQCYLRELKNRGVLLAVCSKNEYSNAIKPFEDNPEMVLKLGDIAAFVANWDNKADNIRAIRDSLNIGLDSMVFLDDNPFERNLVRTLLPEVVVPELPEDAADYVKALCELNLFEAISFTEEDSRRSELYKQDAQRRLVESTASSLEEYLERLEMRIDVGRFTPPLIDRITQLFQRSNQFNLTTHRYNSSECAQMMNDLEGCVPLYASLQDRFGDHGLISIVVLRPDFDHGALEISDWLMSCRVLSRGVEEFLMNCVADECVRLGLKRLTGRYIPSAKNAMVKNFFANFGFLKVAEDQDGVAHWRLDIANFRKKHVYIRSLSERAPSSIGQPA